MVNPIPEGYHTVTPYLVIQGVDDFIAFLKTAFDAMPRERMQDSDGRVVHAEVRIGDSMVMMGEPTEGMQSMPGTLYLYVEDTDGVYQRALEAGATPLIEPTDQYYGDRNAGVADPFGNRWWIATHMEDLSPEELEKRAKEQQAQE